MAKLVNSVILSVCFAVMAFQVVNSQYFDGQILPVANGSSDKDCGEMVKLYKASNYRQICVSEATSKVLIERGYAVSTRDDMKHGDKRSDYKMRNEERDDKMINKTINEKVINKTADTTSPSSEGLTGEIMIGSLLPLTGNLSSKGEENLAGLQLGVDDFNEYLKEKNATWQLKLISEDSETQPDKTLEKLQSLKANGVDIVLGLMTNSNIKHITMYSDSNNMLLLSYSFATPGLVILNDSIYSMASLDDIYVLALAKMIRDGGHDILITVQREDTWGDQLNNATVSSFKANGGTVVKEFRYNPESPEFYATISLLAEEVTKQIAAHGVDKVAPLIITFDEAKLIIHSTLQHNIFDIVSWLESIGNADVQEFLDDPTVSDFMANANFTSLQVLTIQPIEDLDKEHVVNANFTSLQVLTEENPTLNSVKTRISEKLGRAPNIHAYTSYDSVIIIGKTIESVGSADVDDVKSMLVDISNAYTGAVGQVKINEAGDFTSTNYNIWAIQNNTWVIIGTYSQSNDAIMFSWP